MMGAACRSCMRALLACALLLVASLAFAPTAEARPPPPECVYGGIEYTVGPVTVRTNCGAGPSVDVNECYPRETC